MVRGVAAALFAEGCGRHLEKEGFVGAEVAFDAAMDLHVCAPN